ncbi:MAG: hypothetical protein DRJ01_10335 [Bacteroidetes bacterium]|nr:MAG: hypothetical protein DRJ01_10335 [Bacteroidota bacterium]
MNTGSLTNGSYIVTGEQVTDTLDNIQAGLDAVNDKTDEYEYKNADYNMMLNHIEEVKGRDGEKLTYEDWQVFFQDAGVALSPREYNETYNEWTLHCKEFESKNGSFTPDFIKKQIKNHKQPLDILLKRSEGIINKYENVFKPNYLWEAILEVPTSGGGYYEKFGALRNTTVDESLLEDVIEGATDGAKGSLVRNHFRAITNSSGVEASDYQAIKEYFAEYIGIDVNDLVSAGSLGTENILRGVFTDTIMVDDNIVEGELPAIEGIPFRKSKMLPDGIVCFYIDGFDNAIVAKLTSDIKEYTGLNFVVEKDNNKFPTTLGEVQGAKFIIEDIGYQVIGRHQLLFLDITPDNADANGQMKPAGFTLLERKRASLNRQWKNVVR